jgi:chemotaxis family two-component system response regulator Rcp1
MEKIIKILLVEDNEGDIFLTLEAFKSGQFKHKIYVAKDGEQAIKHLNNKDDFENKPLPDLILLDINLPKVDGKEVLYYIKNHPMFKQIPVVMLTTSSTEKDVKDCYTNYANCYVIKPADLPKFMDVVKSIEDFWLSVARIPAHVA